MNWRKTYIDFNNPDLTSWRSETGLLILKYDSDPVYRLYREKHLSETETSVTLLGEYFSLKDAQMYAIP